MVSVLNLSSGLGMIAIAIIAVAGWYGKKHSKPIYFAYGTLFWAAAIAAKVVMDLTVSKPLYSGLYAYLPVDAAVLAVGLYLGLRTGILESGITYLGVKRFRLKEMSFSDAVAVGIGFGGIEALVLGAASLLAVMAFLIDPNLMGLLPLSSRQQFEAIYIPLPVIERLSILFGHVFATVLAIYAVKLADVNWLVISAIYKTLIDGSLPLFGHYLGYMGTDMLFPIEAYLVVMGLLGLAGLHWFGKKYGGAPDAYKAGNPDPGH